jgi:GH15 family glucan-1,4-alpha-glucosidase
MDELNRTIADAKVELGVRAMLRNQLDNGAIVASPDFNEYSYCWLRDGSFIAYALDRARENDAAARYHSWASRAIAGIGDLIDVAIDRHHRGEYVDPNHMPPARFSLDGSHASDDWPNFQIDGYGTWLWALDQHLASTGKDKCPEEFRASVARAGRYLSEFALTPCFDVWEENGTAVHTSTLACVYGGLLAAGRLLDDSQLVERAAEVQSHLHESALPVGRYVKSSENDNVDASNLWLSTPFRVVDPKDDLFDQTVKTIEVRLGLEGGLRRYPTDTYFGGGAWPVLTASLGWSYLAAGDLAAATRCRDWITDHFDQDGNLGEQFGGESRDPEHYLEWVERWGRPAKDLTWSHAMYVVLCSEIDEFEGQHVGQDATVGQSSGESGR